MSNESARDKYSKGKKISKSLLRYHLNNKGSLRDEKEKIKDKLKLRYKTNGGKASI